MISIYLFLPFIIALLLCLVPPKYLSVFKWTAISVAAIEVFMSLYIWVGFITNSTIQFEHHVRWLPQLGIDYRVGIDGISLPLIAMTSVVFLAVYIYSFGQKERLKEYTILFLMIQTSCLGVFLALNLIVFYLFWDLTLILMFFIILLWGHKNRKKAALKFLIYTFVGSLALLLGIIGLYLMSETRTFDMMEIIAQNPLAGSGNTGTWILLALVIGLAIKTPVFPVHTWLPLAHVEAPAAGSAVLAAILLKMGTYGFIRIAISMAPEQWREFAWPMVIIGLISILYGALVALGQKSFKALIAYTSVNHMGYIILGFGALGLVGTASAEMQALIITGSVTQMVAHGLVTGLLFLITGMLYNRTDTYAFDKLGGLAKMTPVFAGFFAIAAVASFGLPGFAHFVAELQIFAGTIGIIPWAGALALVGVLIIAAAMIYSMNRIFFGPMKEAWRQMEDLKPYELVTALLLTISFTIIGLYPRWLIEAIQPVSNAIVEILNNGA